MTPDAAAQVLPEEPTLEGDGLRRDHLQGGVRWLDEGGDEAWCDRVWRAYLEDSIAHGFETRAGKVRAVEVKTGTDERETTMPAPKSKLRIQVDEALKTNPRATPEVIAKAVGADANDPLFRQTVRRAAATPATRKTTAAAAPRTSKAPPPATPKPAAAPTLTNGALRSALRGELERLEKRRAALLTLLEEG